MESVPMARSKLYSAEELLERRRARDRARKKDPAVKARRNEVRRLRAQDPQVLRREADARRRSRHAKKDGAARHKRGSSYASDVIAPSMLIKGTLPPTMAEPAHKAVSPEVSHSQRTQASITTAHMGTQCALGFFTSVGCQTEAGLPGREVDTFEHGVSFGRQKGADNWARKPAEQQGEHGCTRGSSDAGKFACSHRKAQTRGNRQSCERRTYRKIVVTFPKTVHDKKTSVTCSICKAVFSDRAFLYTHMMVHSGEKPYSCPLCPKSFCRRENLALHKKSHAGEKRYVCSVCQRGYSTRAHLIIHERSHTGTTEPAFVCGVCQRGFATKACLVVHERLHTGDKSYTCPYCSKSFTRKDKFFAHERSHTGQKPFPCSACTKSFAAKRDLVIHERSHTGERPYVCDICREGFTSKKRLDSHKRLHTAGTPFVCSPCQLSFTSNDCLLRHIKNVPHELQVNVSITKLSVTKS